MATGIVTGKIIKWNYDKGFGFIKPNKNSKDLFIHISSFDMNASRGPKVGDTVYYYLSQDKSGRPCAASARIAGVEIKTQKPLFKPTKHRPKTARHSFKSFALILCLLIFCVSFAYDKYFRGHSFQNPSIFSVKETPFAPTFQESSRSTFSCEGKTGCHQMDSCEEALFYLHNCPGTKIDGDNDGRPCERGPC